MAVEARQVRGRVLVAGCVGLAFLVAFLVGGGAMAAPVAEHYPPEVPVGRAPRPLIRVETRARMDVAAMGTALGWIDITGVDTSDLEGAWRPFVGQPITPALIGEVERALTARLAQDGRAQVVRWSGGDAGTGALRFDVVDFTLGTVTASGGEAGAQVARRLGLTPGAVVQGRELARDLSSLNRYPFRQVSAQFTPARTGEAYDLTLNVTQQKPWQVYAGFKYSGSDVRSWRRYYAGGAVGNVFGRDSVLAFQSTASPDLVLHGAPHPNVVDSFVTYTLPVTRHGLIEASVEGDEINFVGGGETFRLQDMLGGLGYRLDLTAADGGQRDIRGGVEARHERTILINDGSVTQSAIEVYQLYAGYHLAGDRAGVHDDIDVVVHGSWGGINGGSSGRQAVVYSDGREKTSRYAYGLVTYEGDGKLGTRFTWHSQVMAQMASAALPYTEQLPVGGLAYVRGYKLYDGSFDHALIVRQEVGLAHAAGKPGAYMFVDAGEGRDIGLKRSMRLGSVGAGVKLPLKGESQITVFGVHTLGTGDVTQAGTDELEANLVFKY